MALSDFTPIVGAGNVTPVDNVDNVLGSGPRCLSIVASYWYQNLVSLAGQRIGCWAMTRRSSGGGGQGGILSLSLRNQDSAAPGVATAHYVAEISGIGGTTMSLTIQRRLTGSSFLSLYTNSSYTPPSGTIPTICGPIGQWCSLAQSWQKWRFGCITFGPQVLLRLENWNQNTSQWTIVADIVDSSVGRITSSGYARFGNAQSVAGCEALVDDILVESLL